MTTITQNNAVSSRFRILGREPEYAPVKSRNIAMMKHFDPTVDVYTNFQDPCDPARMNAVPRHISPVCMGDEHAADTTRELIRLIGKDSILPGPEDLYWRLSFQLPDIEQKEDYRRCFADRM